MPNNTRLLDFGAWIPDQPSINNGGLVLAKNVQPDGGFYKPFKQLQAFTSALSSQPFGAFSFISSDGTTHVFVGTLNNLYKLNGTSWDDVTRTSGGTYNSGNLAIRWNFVSLGDRVLACNGIDPIQSYVVDVSTDFADISGAPDAYNLATLNNFAFAIHTTESGTEYPQRVRWSAINDATDWTAAIETLAGFQDFDNPYGKCMSLVGSQNSGILLQERAIWRVDFVGPPEKFTFQLVETGTGAIARNSVVSNAGLIYFYSEGGFKVFDGVRTQGIGTDASGKSIVDDFFLEDADTSLDGLENIIGSIDLDNKLIKWSYISLAGGSGLPDRVLMYHWPSGRFAYSEFDHTLVFSGYTVGQTLEQIGTAYPDLDEDVPVSLDDKSWLGGATIYAGFGVDFKLGYFTGSTLAASFETADVRLNDGGRSTITAANTVVDTSSYTMKIKHRDLPSDSLTSTSSTAPQSSNGECPFLVDARYARLVTDIAAGVEWTKAQGVQFRAEAAGEL